MKHFSYRFSFYVKTDMRLIGAAKTFTSVFSLILAAFLLKDALFPDYKPEVVNEDDAIKSRVQVR